MTQNPIVAIALTLLPALLIYAVLAFGLYKVIRIEKDTREIKAMLAELKAHMKG